MMDFEEREKRRKAALKQVRRDWRAVLATGAGQRVLAEIIMNRCRALEHGPVVSAREVGLGLMEEAARHNADAVVKMVGDYFNGRGDRDEERDEDESGE